jgi:hypothetical protein
LPVPAFAAVLATANTFAISFFICYELLEKKTIMFVASILLGVLLADLVVTENANSHSVVRHANVSSRTEMYVSSLLPMEPAPLVGGPACAVLLYSFAMACN